jgi:trans-aconitate 2-methyltransferase
LSVTEKDWNPEAYARFRGLRLRPALDLLAQVTGLPDGDGVNLGCGDGAAGPALKARFDRPLVGVDASASMLARAQGYDDLQQADIARWVPATPPALIFSNAALHWLGDHSRLVPRLAGLLAKGGTLAVQMPRQFMAPSHRFLRDIAASLFPDRFDFLHYTPPVAAVAEYHMMLAPLGEVQSWETEYVQRLDAAADMHPVQAFTASTAMRPIVEKLNTEEEAAFRTAYDQALGAAYPPQADGAVLYPFRRIFFTLTV